MADKSTIRINRSKETDVEFQVKVDGSDDVNTKTDVRFVIKTSPNVSTSFKASNQGGDAWKVTIPSLPHLKESEYEMEIEVVVDGFLFTPAKGMIVFTTEPKVNIKSAGPISTLELKAATKRKIDEQTEPAAVEPAAVEPAAVEPAAVEPAAVEPVVVAVAESPEVKTTTDPVVESGAGTAADQPVPAAPQKPERKLKEITLRRKKPDPVDDKKAVEEIADHVVPGEGAPYVQEEFNPHKVAENVIMGVLGTRPGTKSGVKPGGGHLFKRNQDGRPIVTGLEDPETKARMVAEAALKEQRVKAALQELETEQPDSDK